MLFAESRPLLPSGVVLISPNFGKDIRSFEAHAKSTNLGIVFQGPKIDSFSPAVRFSVISTENSFRRIATALHCARVRTAPKRNLSFAAGLQGDLINPRSPTTLNFNAGNLAGNLGFFAVSFVSSTEDRC